MRMKYYKTHLASKQFAAARFSQKRSIWKMPQRSDMKDWSFVIAGRAEDYVASDNADYLGSTGFSSWRSNATNYCIGSSIGLVVNIRALLPSHGKVKQALKLSM